MRDAVRKFSERLIGAAPTARVARSYGCSSYEITGSPGAIRLPDTQRGVETAPFAMRRVANPHPTAARFWREYRCLTPRLWPCGRVRIGDRDLFSLCPLTHTPKGTNLSPS